MNEFLAKLRLYRPYLNRNQSKTLRGQAIHGDLEGANKGLNKILNMRKSNG